MCLLCLRERCLPDARDGRGRRHRRADSRRCRVQLIQTTTGKSKKTHTAIGKHFHCRSLTESDSLECKRAPRDSHGIQRRTRRRSNPTNPTHCVALRTQRSRKVTAVTALRAPPPLASSLFTGLRRGFYCARVFPCLFPFHPRVLTSASPAAHLVYT